MRPRHALSVVFFVGCFASVIACGSSGGSGSAEDGGSEASSSSPDAGGDATTGKDGGTNGEDGGSPPDASTIEDASDAADTGPDASRIFGCGGPTASTPDGGALTCDAKTQVCFITTGGPAPGADEAQCVIIPPKCHSNLSCGCMSAQLGGGTCTDNSGDFTVTHVLPADAGGIADAAGE
jgi:hypothetical protein